MRQYALAIFLTGVLLIGCAGPRPLTMTCSTLGTSAVIETGQPVGLGTFSIAAPKGDEWCLGQRGPNHAVFVTNPLMGQYIEKPERSMTWNTIVMLAEKIRHGATSLKNADELRLFVDAWIKRGFAVEPRGAEVIVGDRIEPRFTLLRSSVKPGLSLNADCVRYEYVREERNNPRNPDKILIITDHGAVCHHPTAQDYLVLMAISERYPRGQQIDPHIFDRLKREYGESFFRSLEFAKAD